MPPSMGGPSLTPGIYIGSLLIGYFEGIDGERGIAWRLADSLALRHFVGIGLTEDTPDHSTISRTRRRIDVETHEEVFGWVLKLLADRGLRGQGIGIDALSRERSLQRPREADLTNSLFFCKNAPLDFAYLIRDGFSDP